MRLDMIHAFGRGWLDNSKEGIKVACKYGSFPNIIPVLFLLIFYVFYAFMNAINTEMNISNIL